MKITALATDSAILQEIGERIARSRLNKNLTQEDLAESAGVSRPTLQRLEAGSSSQIINLLRVLRALGILENLEALIPSPSASPLQQVKQLGKIRQRASQATSTSPITSKNSGSWKWGDEK